jgi:hypothetical protein
VGKKIKLFHVSFDITEPLCKLFIPRVPKNPMNGEDEIYKRICFSDSVTGCINSIGKVLEPYDNTDSVTIIVWEKEVDLLDKNLISWRRLYEDNLVPDAAITHEYWYLEKTCIDGAYYQVMNVKETMENKIQIDIIKPCYKEKILKILLKYGVDVRNIDNVDACTLVNEWIPSNIKEFRECIMNEIKKEMSIVCEREVDEELYEKIFGYKPEIETMIDSVPIQIFQKIEIERL